MGITRSDDAAMRVARRVLGVFALVGTTAVVWFGFVDPAGANAPTVKVSCVGGQSVLTVEVRDYNGRVTNTVSVLDDGKVLDSRRFGSSYRNSFIRPGNVEHSYRVVVRAGDDRSGDQGFSFDRTVPQQVCAQVTPTTTQNRRRSVPVPSTTTTHTTPPPVTTTTTTAQPPARTTSAEATTTTTTTTSTTRLPPSPVPPLVSLVEPPPARVETTTVGSAPAPSGRTSSSSTGDGRGPKGGETTSSTTSSPVTAPRTTTEDNVVVVADDTNLPTTGASIAIPLLFGLCFLTAGGVVVFSMRSPRKRGRHAA